MGDIKDTIASFTKSFTKTSSGIIKTTKISISLANEESNLNTLYTEIGKKVHEIYAYGGTLGKVFDDKYKEILEIEAKITGLRGELDAAKGTKTCPHCGKVANKDSEFCPKCGKNMVDVPVVGGGSDFNMGSAADFHEPRIETKFEQTNENYNRHEVPKENNEAIIALEGTNIEPQTKNSCRTCGAENVEGDKFCLSCGRML